MWKHVPTGVGSDAALVVVLHGCGSDADEHEDLSGWSDLADTEKFYVLYPEQKSANNLTSCFNWFEPDDIERGDGEALSIKQMVDEMKDDYSIDDDEVYITGMSAGGGFTNVMAATYPDVFAGASPMAGAPYKCATTVAQSATCMTGSMTKTPSEWGDLVTDAYDTYTGDYPRILIWHGIIDTTVLYYNSNEQIEQWTDVHGIDQTAETDDYFRGNHRREYEDGSSNLLVKHHGIVAMAHAIPVDPGTAEDEGGSTGTFAKDHNLHSTYYTAKFWGLVSGGGDTGADYCISNNCCWSYSCTGYSILYDQCYSTFTWNHCE